MGKEKIVDNRIEDMRKDGFDDEMIEAILEVCLSDKRVIGEERQRYKEMLYNLHHGGR